MRSKQDIREIITKFAKDNDLEVVTVSKGETLNGFPDYWIHVKDMKK